MPFSQAPVRVALSLLALAAGLGTGPTLAQAPAARLQPVASPWGVSASARSYRNHAEWMPKVAAAGVSSVRLFPEWRGVEPQPGKWNWEQSDSLVKNAAANKLELTGVLMGSPPGAKAVHAFPMDDLAGWSGFVVAAAGRYKGQIRHWEVWNEGNGGFNDGKHTTEDYAKLAAATYDAAKKANPDVQVGLSVASFDAPYLNQAILAQAKAGTPNRFDFLAIHPYEIADGLADPDGEIPFLWMTRQLRAMLKTSAPERANAEIWITEVGRRLDTRQGRVVTEEDAASDLIKLYTMAIAQGVARTQWFEARDPEGEDQGFGLLQRDGSERAAYRAMSGLAKALGPHPKYEGWIALGPTGSGYSFVFATQTGSVAIAWATRGSSVKMVSAVGQLAVYDPVRNETTLAGEGIPFDLTSAPVILRGDPETLKLARMNAAKPFPWGGDYANASNVIGEPGNPDASRGIFQTHRDATPRVKFADGSTGILLAGDIGHPVSFFVHPSFASLATREYYVRATVRRVGAGNVGMNLTYEVADSQGRSPYTNVGQWFGTKEGDGWQTHTWRVTDACFAKMWGFDFSIRPEQSVPFVLGKVEVSTKPF